MACALSLPVWAQGYFIGSVPHADGQLRAVNPNKPTHIFIVGIADELLDQRGNLSMQAAASTAKLYRAIYPDSQIVMFVAREKAGGVRKVDAKKLEEIKKGIDAANLEVQQLRAQSQNARRDFFGRSEFDRRIREAQFRAQDLQREYNAFQSEVQLKSQERYTRFRANEEEHIFGAGLLLFREPSPGLFDQTALSGADLVKFLLTFKAIDSMHLFGHQGARTGLALHGERMGMHTTGIAKLKPNFTKDSYAILYGCNSALEGASALSKMWSIPVSGSLTATDMQRLHSSGQFYHEGDRFPKTGSEAQSNDLSFGRPVNCYNAAGGKTPEGGCIRMKPDNVPYTNGAWGSYSLGLGFYKFFCNYDSPVGPDGLRTDDCYRRMARSLRGWVSTRPLVTKNEAEFREVLYDFLCPTEAWSNLRKDCIQKLQELENVPGAEYNPFNGGARRCVNKVNGLEIQAKDRKQPNGTTLTCEQAGGESLPGSMSCDEKRCYAHFQCDKGPDGSWVQSTCRMLPNKGYERAKETTLLDEYRRYLRGFQQLQY